MISDYLAGLLAAPTVSADQVAGKVAELAQKAPGAKQAWLAAQAAARQANDWLGVTPGDVRQAPQEASSEPGSEEAALARAEQGRNALSALFDTRLSDLAGLSQVADGFADGKVLGKLADLAVANVVAGGVSPVVNAQQDISHGVPAWLAYLLETGGTVAGFAAGMAVAGVVSGAVAGLPIPGAPMLGAAAGTAAAGVVAYGVGDYIHHYIQDFGAQWDRHGVLGIVTDFGAAGVGTWGDTKHLAADAGQAAGDVGQAVGDAWHGITSLLSPGGNPAESVRPETG